MRRLGRMVFAMGSYNSHRRTNSLQISDYSHFVLAFPTQRTGSLGSAVRHETIRIEPRHRPDQTRLPISRSHGEARSGCKHELQFGVRERQCGLFKATNMQHPCSAARVANHPTARQKLGCIRIGCGFDPHRCSSRLGDFAGTMLQSIPNG